MSAPSAEVAAYERLALEAMQAGRQREAVDAWARVVSLQPDHAVALTQLGQVAFKQSDFATARLVFERAAAADGSKARQWINVALACQQVKDDAAEEAALFKALAVDPYDLLALVLRGAMYERQGKASQAAAAYGAAATVSPPLDRLSPVACAAMAKLGETPRPGEHQSRATDPADRGADAG